MRGFADHINNWSTTQIFFVKRQKQFGLVGYVIFFVNIFFLSANLQTAQAADGDLDPTFGTGGRLIVQIAEQVRDFATAIAVQPDGKIVVGGEVGDYTSPSNSSVLVRLNPDGTLDQSFGNGGQVINNVQIHLLKIAIQPDGKIVTAALISLGAGEVTFAVVRYNPDGSLDQTFGNGGSAVNGVGVAQSLILQPDGKIVLVGYLPIFRNGSDYLLARFNADGSIDQSFGTDGRVQTSFTSGRDSADQALDAALQADGKIVVTGFAGGFSPVLIRYNSDGSIDTNFGLDGSVLTPNFGAVAKRIIIQPDGKIVVAGGAFVLGRFNPNGTTDHSFGNNGRTSGGFGIGNGYANGIVLQADGKLLVAGSVAYTDTGNAAFLLGRYNADGTFDQTFGNNGFVITEFTDALDEANALALQPDGKVILAGYEAEDGATYVDFGLARFLTSAAARPTQFDFDGDSRADISVFRSSMWYLNGSTNGFWNFQFGLNTDLLTPADFDGDGKADISVFRSEDGNWYCYNSGNGTSSIKHFGQNGDLPVPADYDGDGRADPAVFRSGVWYIQRSTAGLLITQFGLSGDNPVPADFDGDGQTDLAVYRSGTWYVQKSSGGTVVRQFGLSGDLPVVCDYDGDGKAEIAVWRPTDGVWYLLKSSDGSYASFQFGINGDLPVPGDYDGDGKADLAIYRGSGEWWIWLSRTNNYSVQQFGIVGDMPVPSAYIR